MREVNIDTETFVDRRAVYDFLAAELAFPDYFGANLDALADCLGDIATETRIVVHRTGSYDDAMDEFFLRLSKVLVVAGSENPALHIVIADD